MLVYEYAHGWSVKGYNEFAREIRTKRLLMKIKVALRAFTDQFCKPKEPLNVLIHNEFTAPNVIITLERIDKNTTIKRVSDD